MTVKQFTAEVKQSGCRCWRSNAHSCGDKQIQSMSQSAAELLVVRRGNGAGMCLVSGLSQSGTLGRVSLQRKQSQKGMSSNALN